MGYIFISYSHKDQKYVEKLAKYLGEKGFDAWFDYRIRFGMYWSKALEKAIDDSDAFIVVVSNAAKESEWVTREILRAQAKNKPLFPLLLEGENGFFYKIFLMWMLSMVLCQLKNLLNL